MRDPRRRRYEFLFCVNARIVRMGDFAAPLPSPDAALSFINDAFLSLPALHPVLTGYREQKYIRGLFGGVFAAVWPRFARQRAARRGSLESWHIGNSRRQKISGV